MENLEIPKYVGSKIKYYRTANNITQEELGEYLHTTSQTISRYESGILHTDIVILFKIAGYFGISINEFFPPTNKKSSEQLDDNYKAILIKKGLMDKNGNIDEKNFEKVINIGIATKQILDNEKNWL